MALENFSRGTWAGLGGGGTLPSKFQRLAASQV